MAQQQGRFFVKHPLQRLDRGMLVGPGLAVADRDLRRIGVAGLQRGVGLAIHDGDVVAQLQQVPGCAGADDAGAEDDDFHALQCD